MSVDLFVEAELDGPGLGWTEIDDVVLDVPVNWNYGVDGSSPNDRVAQSGAASFALDNSTDNSGHLLGYYSPGHANCRPGWKLGVAVRFRLRYADLGDYFKFSGIVDEVRPIPGLFGERRVYVTCVDYMDDVARASIAGLPVQTNQRSDQLFTTLVANMPRQPPGIERGYGMEAYAYALDGARDEGVSVMTEFQKLAQSELGFIYVKGDPLSGGVLTFEDRRKRGTSLTSVGTFDRLNVLTGGRKRNQVTNRVLVKVHPRRVDAAGSGAFMPSDIASLTLWVQGDDLEATLDDGDPVSLWTDRSPILNDLVNPSGTDRPTYASGVANGHGAVLFDSTDDFLLSEQNIANMIVNNAGTIFVAFYPTRSDTRNVFGTDSTPTAIQLQVRSGPLARLSNNDGAINSVDVSGLVLNRYSIATWLHAGGQLSASLDNTQDSGLSSIASGNTANTATKLRVGAVQATPVNFYGGYVAEIIAFNTALSENDRMKVESYLSDKYAVTIPYLPIGLGGVTSRIFRLDDKPFIARATTYKMKAIYKDENQAAQRIGATNQQQPVAGTDFTFNTHDDDTGTNIPDQLSFSIDFGGNSADVEITNNGPNDGYLTSFQLRGLGVYDEGEVILEAKDEDLIEEYGENVLPYDMPYQSDPAIALDAASYLLSLNKSELTVADRVGFIADQADDLMRHAILREISDRITVVDEVTAVDGDFFINSISCTIDSEGKLSVEWGITPAATDVFWILDSPTQSQLDETTKLAYGLWNRYWIMGVATMGTDTRLSS